MRRVWITCLALLLAGPFVWLELGLRGSQPGVSSAPLAWVPEKQKTPAYSWERVRRLAGSTSDVAAIALVGNPNRLVMAHRHGRLTVWDIASGVQTLSIRAHRWRCRAVATDADGPRIAVATPRRIKVYDTQTQQRIHRFPVRMAGAPPLAMSADGAFLAATTKPHDVTVWDLADGAVAFHILELTAGVSAVSLSADGSRVAVACRDGGVAVWDVGAGKVIRTLVGHGAAVRSVDLPGDGRVLATGSDDKTAKVWDLDTGAVLATVSYATAPVTSVKLKNDATRLVLATGSGAIDLWHVETSTRIRRYGSRALSRRRLAVSPDGSVVAAVGNACSLWAAGTGDELSAWRDRGHRVAGVQLSLDGARALAFYVDGGSALYDVETAARLRTFASPPPPRR